MRLVRCARQEYVVEYLDNACEKVNWIKRAGRCGSQKMVRTAKYG